MLRQILSKLSLCERASKRTSKRGRDSESFTAEQHRENLPDALGGLSVSLLRILCPIHSTQTHSTHTYIATSTAKEHATKTTSRGVATRHRRVAPRHTHTAWPPPPPHQLPSFPEIRKSHYAVATLYIFTTAHAKAACKPDLDQLLTFRGF